MTSPRFTYDDVVRALPTAPLMARPSARAWIVAVYTDPKPGEYFAEFGDGVVYTVEFEDGTSTEVRENDLEFWV
jgi:hypothetical protein